MSTFLTYLFRRLSLSHHILVSTSRDLLNRRQIASLTHMFTLLMDIRNLGPTWRHQIRNQTVIFWKRINCGAETGVRKNVYYIYALIYHMILRIVFDAAFK